MSLKSWLHKASVAIGNVNAAVQHDVKAGLHSIVSGVEDVPFAVLLPFKSMMQHELDVKGIKHSGTLHELAPLFLEHIVKPSQGHFESFENFTPESHNIIDEVATAVINAIINFIKSLKNKKDSGATLTPVESRVLGTSQVVTAKVIDAGQSAAKDAVSDKIRAFLFSWKGAVAIGLLGALIAYAVYAGHKK